MARGAVGGVSEVERAELDAVLRSRILQRSPSVLRIAEYIARTYLEGNSEDLKEYNIAVDALGKLADFDPKRDSIVRVEVHRLRKKIDEFYRTEGAGHALRLVIDPGKYVPRFETTVPVAIDGSPLVVVPELPLSLPVAPKKSKRWVAFVAVAVTLALAAYWRIVYRSPPPSDPIFLMAGAPAELVTAADTGMVVHGDHCFRGGEAVFPSPLFPLAPGLSRIGQRTGNFDYDIPLSSEPWELRLYFGPRIAGEEESGRIGHGFDVLANGARLIDAQDPDLGWAPPKHSIVRTFRDIRAASDHKLHLSFRNGREQAYVSAIGLTPGENGRLLPIRLISKGAPWTDNNGRTWISDSEFADGGKLKLRAKFDAGGFDPNLMVGERYGEFSYHIPVSEGTYGLKLYFAESWFGPGMGGGGGIGSRRFDVYADRNALLQDFDIFREAGHRPVIKEFHGLRANADGYISLRFVARVNHASVNALELLEETGGK